MKITDRVIYLAGGFHAQPMYRALRDMLQDRGACVVSRWIDCATPSDDRDAAHYTHWAQVDVDDLFVANTLILYSDQVGSKGGCWVEVGVALAWFEQVIIVGERTNAFTYLPQVTVVRDTAELLDYLSKEDGSNDDPK